MKRTLILAILRVLIVLEVTINVCYAETFNGVDFNGNVTNRVIVHEETITKYKDDKDVVGYRFTGRSITGIDAYHLVLYNCKTKMQIYLDERFEATSSPNYSPQGSVGRAANDYACNYAGIPTR